MLFKHLVTEFRWSRSFSLKELSKFSEISEKKIVSWEKGHIPLPKDALRFQKALAYPRIKFWSCYFKSLCVEFDINLDLDLQNYEDQAKLIEHSRSLRSLLNHKSIPHDEVVWQFSHNLNPQNINTVLMVQSKFSKKGVASEKDLISLAKKYELDISVIKRLIKEKEEPSFEELTVLIERSDPGYDRERMLLGYFSLLVEKYELNLFLDKHASEGYLQQLEKLSKTL